MVCLSVIEEPHKGGLGLVGLSGRSKNGRSCPEMNDLDVS